MKPERAQQSQGSLRVNRIFYGSIFGHLEGGPRIRLLLADDNEVIRFGLQTLLANETDITVIGAAADGQAAVTMAVADPPDVLVIDLSMPVLDGFAAIREIARDAPSVKILVLTSYSHESLVRDAFAAGAHGYVLKGGPATELLEAIRNVYLGESLQ